MTSDQLIERLSSGWTPSPRFRPLGRRLVVVLVSTFVLGGVVTLLLGFRPDFASVRGESYFRLGVFSGLFLLATSLALGLVSAIPGALRSHRSLSRSAWIAGLSLLATSLFRLGQLWNEGDRFSDLGSGCTVTLLGFGAIVSIPLISVVRRGAPFETVRSAFFVAVSGFSFGWLLLEFHCPGHSVSHRGWGHLGAPVLFLFLALPSVARAVGRNILRRVK